ncbi:MAG: ABC transporter ATP-binding protein [Cyclobacteriaceae bacterium]
MNNVVIEVRNVSKSYSVLSTSSLAIKDIFLKGKNHFKRRKINALSNVSFEVHKNEKLGIIGRNGSGKSTIINLIMGALKSDKGSISTHGKIMKLETGVGFDNEMNAKQNVMLNSSLMGLPKATAEERYREIIEFAELEEYEGLPIKHLSKGMKSRLAFASAMYMEPDIILLDEFFGGGGDARFKVKSDKVFEERILQNKTLIIVSHSLSIIEQHCDRVLWLDKGTVEMLDIPALVIEAYKDYRR